MWQNYVRKNDYEINFTHFRFWKSILISKFPLFAFVSPFISTAGLNSFSCPSELLRVVIVDVVFAFTLSLGVALLLFDVFLLL